MRTAAFELPPPMTRYFKRQGRRQVEGGIARVRLNRPERMNPLTFESYAELRDTFRDLV